MIGRGTAIVGLLVVGVALTACSRPEDRTADRIETLLMTEPSTRSGPMMIWPSDAPLRTYVRYYQPVADYRGDSDLPPTTMVDTMRGWPEGTTRRVVFGIYLRQGSLWDEDRAAGRVHVASGQLPQAFHGGCDVVNVAYDPEEDRILGVWCNVP